MCRDCLEDDFLQLKAQASEALTALEEAQHAKRDLKAQLLLIEKQQRPPATPLHHGEHAVAPSPVPSELWGPFVGSGAPVDSPPPALPDAPLPMRRHDVLENVDGEVAALRRELEAAHAQLGAADAVIGDMEAEALLRQGLLEAAEARAAEAEVMCLCTRLATHKQRKTTMAPVPRQIVRVI